MSSKREPPAQTRGLKRVEYECLVEHGLLGPDDKIELIDGVMLVREPEGPRHVVAVQLTIAALQRVFGAGWNVRHPGPASLYARAAITDYWIVNLVDRVVEMRRGPVTSDAAAFGWTYDRLTVARPGESLTPLAAPLATIPVSDLLP